ncbi:hypothetical protein SLEP1_g54101 [Rubroshorea leprosula]|uniref:Uncharacterized protein n=1 Tax=Rubroshorea leprosula TaxID=152421 RepID=A0AAV5MEZ9_9ROSI|nr:hypothetical protein SLEP1_g54101 [Rubroshorea leprosula]
MGPRKRVGDTISRQWHLEDKDGAPGNYQLRHIGIGGDQEETGVQNGQGRAINQDKKGLKEGKIKWVVKRKVNEPVGEDRELMKDLVDYEKAWLSRWFERVKLLLVFDVGQERFVWIKLVGLLLHAWN